MKYEDDFRTKLIEITSNHHRLNTIGMELKFLLRLMLENNEMQEFLLSRMNETALEAAAL